MQSSDEPVDPMPALRDQCRPKCQNYWKDYEACGERIKRQGVGDCEPWFFDFLHCVDKCVVPKVMKHTV